MEVIKRKISLEDSTDRSNGLNWGTLTATTFYINVFLTQNIDDMGLFTDLDYTPLGLGAPDYTILSDRLALSGYSFPFMTGGTPSSMTGITETDLLTLRFPSYTESSYYTTQHNPISGLTDTKIDDLMTYKQSNRYVVGFDMDVNTYVNYNGNTINDSVSRIALTGEPTVYVFDTENDINIGTENQTTGIQYSDYTGITRNVVIDGISNVIPQTSFMFIGEGRNQTNTSLSALTKEEYLFGIISPPEVKNDVFIDRGVTSVLDYHLRMSEIRNLGQLTRYNNGFYNLTKQ
jgi:hypothetical protein